MWDDRPPAFRKTSGCAHTPLPGSPPGDTGFRNEDRREPPPDRPPVWPGPAPPPVRTIQRVLLQLGSFSSPCFQNFGFGFPFFNFVNMVCAQLLHNLLEARGPADLHLVHGRGRAQTEMDARRALRAKSVAAVDEAEPRLPACRPPDLRPDGRPIRFRPRQQELRPVVLRRLGIV